LISHLEYCACGHPNDHVGKPCVYVAGSVNERFSTGDDDIAPAERCPCQSGIRIDVATFNVLCDQTALIDQQRMLLAEQSQTLARILAVLEESSGLKSRLVDAGNGRARVEVKPKIVVVGM